MAIKINLVDGTTIEINENIYIIASKHQSSLMESNDDH